MSLILISHIVNVIVAGTMCVLLITNNARMTPVYGEPTPARSILASLHGSIAALSLFAIIFPIYSIIIALVLFPLQILYKLSTPITVGRAGHPVVVSNIAISILHLLSLATLL